MDRIIPIETIDLILALDLKLIELLRSLTEEEWNAQTVAKLWTVKDVAAHLLDGNLRSLSTSRDHFFGEKPERMDSYQDLVDFLNSLNHSWVKAMKRVSPQILTTMLEASGKDYFEHLQTLDPWEDALYPVAWAGQDRSPNWFHIAREYTEKFLHQQQIREAVAKPGIMTREFFHPFLDSLMQAFPHTFRDIIYPTGTVVSLEISSEIGGTWSLIRTEHIWMLRKEAFAESTTLVTMEPDTAWKLFSKSWKPEAVLDIVDIKGDQKLGRKVLDIVAFMA
ncbi:maleylpyruvate isomerase family mycothiol-dependent enzyme [Algoriphagus jejuensis]|uniref:Maleylpyruvate isomerase family mycothiol-dependent enzyme n=1 Tax=Algoriphagus jejuensis TaxID=419934 RepID=A0ABP3YG39_9BACT